MKYLLFLMVGLAFVITECGQSRNIVNSSQHNQHIEMQTKRIGDLEYTIKVKKQSDTFLKVGYEVKNLGESNYLLYNRGTSQNMRSGVIFIEPLPDNVIELSQKRFFEPKDKNCPDREAPIYPAASWLMAKQTVTEDIGVTLPLKVLTPFGDCEPRLEMPKEIKNIKFCLGSAKANLTKNLKANQQGIVIVRGGENIEEQQLLCSDIIELK